MVVALKAMALMVRQMTPQNDYQQGWKDAINAVAGMLRTEAGACIGDIVPGDEIGARGRPGWRKRCGCLVEMFALDEIRGRSSQWN